MNVMMIISFIHMVVLVIKCILLQNVRFHYFCKKGDYYGYLVEFNFGNGKKDVVDISMKVYEAATTTTKSQLPPTLPIRLGQTLNFSVFYYKCMNST
uniref:14-3-3 domain-containing protein n=1 Tax=Lactuca sativa TaxID=4236 RepID=A0A9R1VW86_LACSA|nr:hypothetical protein LSAT_V11C400214170 [Lactuca sativa]